jgi:hypothetical protein
VYLRRKTCHSTEHTEILAELFTRRSAGAYDPPPDQPPQRSHYLTSRHVPNEKMDLGSGFLAKLEPFLLMSKSAKGAAAAKLILDATGSPGVFVFGELLDVPSIQEVRVRPYELEGFANRALYPAITKRTI